jgi:hypothetical protein
MEHHQIVPGSVSEERCVECSHKKAIMHMVVVQFGSTQPASTMFTAHASVFGMARMTLGIMLCRRLK